MIVIEMNPACRAVQRLVQGPGFPYKNRGALAVGMSLDEIPNDITKKNALVLGDYDRLCVVKIPKWQFEKFHGADPPPARK